MQLLKSSSYKQMPWKNGFGITAEIDRYPAGEGSYLWRLSQATISADGPFSSFPGYDRYLMVWRGAGIILGDIQLQPLTPFRFSGDQAQSCRLIADKVVDVGLIFDRNRVKAEMSVVSGRSRRDDPGVPAVHYIFDLESGDTLKFEGPLDVEITNGLLISIQLQKPVP